MNIEDCENANNDNARNVVNPPLNTAGPIVSIAQIDLSNLVPKEKVINIDFMKQYKRKYKNSAL